MSLQNLQRWRLILGKAAEDPFKPVLAGWVARATSSPTTWLPWMRL